MKPFGILFLVVFVFGLIISDSWVPILLLVIGIKLLNMLYNGWVTSARSKGNINEINHRREPIVRDNQRKPKKGRPLPVHMKKQVV